MTENEKSPKVLYCIVEHNPKLFTVMSEVTGKGFTGFPTTFKNFVAQCDSYEEAKTIIGKLENLE